MIASFVGGGKGRVWAVTGATILPIALADWAIGARASLGVLYILPMTLAATVARPAETFALAVFCSILRSLFDVPGPPLDIVLRFVFAVVAYTGSGLVVSALIRNRQLEQQLTVLVESSPAAILTTDASGRILACNRAAALLFMADTEDPLPGRPIGRYIPLLAGALQLGDKGEGLRTTAQCQGRRENGEVFLAHTWFSSYMTPEGRRLAAIVVDSSEEMRDREEEGLRQLMRGNRIAAAAVSHEVRNLCGAISLICSNLRAKHQVLADEDFQGLATLVAGLERIASSELYERTHEELTQVDLREVLDDLRIVIERDWHEISGDVIWDLPKALPAVLGERSGLLQAFLNIAQNSHRAVEECAVRELRIAVAIDGQLASVRFQDTGPGILNPGCLFEPFQSGADGSGLGLYVSRAVVRSYGGDLAFEPRETGACFRVDMAVVLENA